MKEEQTFMAMRNLLSLRWIITTLLVVIAIGVMIRLGFWQLVRLAQRRAFNAAVQAQMTAPTLALNHAVNAPGFKPNDLTQMEYRSVTVTGVYDPANQVILRNQVNDNLPGYHLLTPLKIAGAPQSVLIDRGFIPLNDKTPADWAKYDRAGPVTVSGVIRLGHVPQVFGVPDPALAPRQVRLEAWNNLNLTRIRQQIPYTLLPVYIQAAPEPSAGTSQPIAAIDQPDLTEGPHLGYALQWFAFAATLALGYPFFVRKQLRDAAKTEPARVGELPDE